MEKYYIVLDICLILLFGETRFLVFVNILVPNIIHNRVVVVRYILQENLIFEFNHSVNSEKNHVKLVDIVINLNYVNMKKCAFVYQVLNFLNSYFIKGKIKIQNS